MDTIFNNQRSLQLSALLLMVLSIEPDVAFNSPIFKKPVAGYSEEENSINTSDAMEGPTNLLVKKDRKTI